MYRCAVLRVSPSSLATSLTPISRRSAEKDERIASPRSSDCDVPGRAVTSSLILLFYILERRLDKSTVVERAPGECP